MIVPVYVALGRQLPFCAWLATSDINLFGTTRSPKYSVVFGSGADGEHGLLLLLLLSEWTHLPSAPLHDRRRPWRTGPGRRRFAADDDDDDGDGGA